MIIKRFLFIVLVGIIVSFSLLTYFVVDKETSLLEKSAQEKTSLYAVSVSSVLTRAMLEGTPNIARDIVHELNSKGDIHVTLFKANGAFLFGEADMSIPADKLGVRQETVFKQKNHLVHLSPFLNKAECHKCHGADPEILGFAAVHTHLDSIASNIIKTERHLVIFGILLVLSAAFAVFMAAKHMLLDPILKIHRGVERIRKGELHYRLSIDRKDEIGALAATFNDMVGSVQKSHDNLEKAVRQKTMELRVIAELSLEVFKGDRPLETIISQFLGAITGKMGFDYSVLCLVDKETGILSHEYLNGIDEGFCSLEISLAGQHPFAKAVRDAKPSVRTSSEVGMPGDRFNMVIMPLLSHQRKRCREINLCSFESCPAYANQDDRCWMIDSTLCRSPQAVAGKEKIYGCLHCPAFPVLGVLVAGRNDEINKSSVHSIEILASELASAIENQRLIEAKKTDIRKLIELHDISIESLQGFGETFFDSIVKSAGLFPNMDEAVLWITGPEGKLHYRGSLSGKRSGIPQELSLESSFAGRAIVENRLIETLNVDNLECLAGLIHENRFLYAAAIPLKYKNRISGSLTLFKKKDFLMTDSERAIVLLYASQVAASINTARLYEELAERERSYRSLSENLPGIVYRIYLREENRMQFFNDMVLQMTGYASTENESSDVCSIIKLILPEDRDKVSASVNRSIDSNSPFELEYRVRHKNGGIRYFLERGRPAYGTDGGPLYLDGVIFDITDNKLAENELKNLFSSLKAEKEFSDAIFNGAASGILVLDAEGRILKINMAGLDILSLDREMIRGRFLTDIYPEAEAMLQVSSEIGREIFLDIPGGSIRPIGFNSSLIAISGEEKHGLIVLFRDMSEIKRLQAEARKKDHFEAMGKLISGVAHEVRNPLFGISSIGQILERELDSSQHQALIQAMLREADRMKRLIEELLLYTRPARLDKKALDVGLLIEELKHYVSAKRENLRVDLDISPAVMIAADRDKLIQVFLNLLNNAIEAAVKSIGISVKRHKGVVEIIFSDDGPGIKNEDFPRLFDPFFTTKKGGTGLGLPICKKIVEDHGGSIDIIRGGNGGTQVILTFDLLVC